MSRKRSLGSSDLIHLPDLCTGISAATGVSGLRTSSQLIPAPTSFESTKPFLSSIIAKMGWAKKNEPVEVVDPTAWIIDNEFASFVLMHTNEIVS